MFRNKVAFKGICTLILFITIGISQASVPVRLEIGNPQDDPAGGSDRVNLTKSIADTLTPMLQKTKDQEDKNTILDEKNIKDIE